MKRKLMLLLACLFVGIGLVTAQTQTITGVVISEEDGQPVIGASVLVKGTQLGTITGVDGDFTLSNVPSSAKTLQISYIGMQAQEVAIKPDLKVVLKADSEILDEVVVVAYGTAKKSSFTGSASTVKADRLEKQQNSNVSKALEGAVAGGLLFERILPTAIRIDGVDDGQDFTVTQRDLRLERTIRMLGDPIGHLCGGLIVER